MLSTTFFSRLALFCALSFGFTLSGYGATITAVSSGNWNQNARWDLGRQPISGDTIVIPVGVTVNIPTGNANDLTGPEVTVLRIYGSLYFASFFEGAANPMSFDLNDGDKVEIYEGGTVSSNTTWGYSGFVFEGDDEICLPIIGCFATEVEDFPVFDDTFEGPMTIEDGISTPLPVDLISFDAVLSFSSVKIQWSTASELNNDYFTLERSKDGINYETLTTVQGFGTTNEVQEYEFVDEKPVFGWSYYRLSQTDFDGTSEVFDPVTVEFTPQVPELTIFPNPVVHDKFQAQITGDFGVDQASIEVYDLHGNRILSQVYEVQNGEFLDAEVYMRNNLQAGHYIVHVNLGSRSFTSRILKN